MEPRRRRPDVVLPYHASPGPRGGGAGGYGEQEDEQEEGRRGRGHGTGKGTALAGSGWSGPHRPLLLAPAQCACLYGGLPRFSFGSFLVEQEHSGGQTSIWPLWSTSHHINRIIFLLFLFWKDDPFSSFREMRYDRLDNSHYSLYVYVLIKKIL